MGGPSCYPHTPSPRLVVFILATAAALWVASIPSFPLASHGLRGHAAAPSAVTAPGGSPPGEQLWHGTTGPLLGGEGGGSTGEQEE